MYRQLVQAFLRKLKVIAKDLRNKIMADSGRVIKTAVTF